ncbi:hypothetical protein GmHk_17G049672 [Glycine max]|nr:hypothetical protein GmHk_17G049672 [Glycine max]
MTLCFMPVELGLQLLSIILVSMLLVLPASVHFNLCFDTRSLYFGHSCQHSISLHFDVPSLSFILFLCSECSRFKRKALLRRASLIECQSTFESVKPSLAPSPSEFRGSIDSSPCLYMSYIGWPERSLVKKLPAHVLLINVPRQRMIFLSWFGRTIRFRARVSPVELEGAPLARVCHLTDYHLTVLRLGIKM